MIMRMRLYPMDTAEPIWDYVNRTFGDLKGRKVTPLFASIQTGARFVSVFFLVDDVEELGDLLVNEIGKCEAIADTVTIPMLKMAFLPVVDQKVEGVRRYSIMVKTRPRHYYSVYNGIINLKPDKGVMPNFAAFTLGEYDMMLSVWSTSEKMVEDFVSTCIRTMEDVVRIEIFPIAKTRIFMSEEDWKRFQRVFLYIPSWVTDEMRSELAYAFYPTEEDIGLSGGMTEES